MIAQISFRTGRRRGHAPVISGLGVLVPGACGADSFWGLLGEERSAVGPLEWAGRYGLRSRVAGVVAEALLDDVLPDPRNKLTRQCRLALPPAREAIDDVDRRTVDLLVAATAIGPFSSVDIDAMSGASRSNGENFYFDHLASTVRERLHLSCPTVTVTTGCTSGIDAVGYAMEQVARGRCRCVLVVGADAPLSPTTLAAFDRIGALSTSFNDSPRLASRPFDRRRDGFVLGEAGAAILVEEHAAARRRGANVLAEMLGFGSVSSAFHMTSISADGRHITQAIRAAADSCSGPQRVLASVRYINAHGSSTQQNDRAEAAAYHEVFGPGIAEIPVTSTKSVTGHSLGAASLVEINHAVLSMRKRSVTPNVNLDHPDDRRPLRLPRAPIHPYDHGVVLKTASGFSGIHSALLMRSL